MCAIETKDCIPLGHIDWFNNSIPTLYSFEEGNMTNISPTVKINISIKPRIVEEITIGVACSPKELTSYKALFQEYQDIFSWSYTNMPSLDPFIAELRIDTWPDFALVRQNKRPLHPFKVVAIKVVIDKLHVVHFIYPIAYTSWVSNPIPVKKKQGTIVFAQTFAISTMSAMRHCPLWMGSPITIKSKSIQQINIKPLLLHLGYLFLSFHASWNKKRQFYVSKGHDLCFS
jgi:hypothetical protein